MKKKVKILEYLEFNKIIDNEKVNDFVSTSMNVFIGRPHKRRNDIIDIGSYYIKNGGNFWIAVDNNKIVGTIAFQVKENKGILKRFYVDKEYQNKGIGTQLYEIFEKYVIEKTSIRHLYLACGKVLKNAHKFYLKNGWKQINNLEIEMHTVENDDYFMKVL